MAFNQKNVQKEGFKKSKFFYNHDVSSTYEFGECQPLLCHLCATGQESHSIRMNSIVRMSPLVFPTFGRVIHKVTHHFVPFSALWQHWDKALSDVETTVEQVVDSQLGETTLLPTRFPSLSLDVLMQILLRQDYSSFRVVSRTGYGISDNNFETDNSYATDSVLSQLFGYVVSATPKPRFVGIEDMQTFYDLNLPPDQRTDLLPESSDFSVMTHVEDGNKDVMLLVKLTTKGKRLYKVLTGLGYTPSFTNHTEVNLLPLFAFYKAYFDAYAVQQYRNFFTSNCYKLITHINSLGTVDILGGTPSFGVTEAFRNEILAFFDDLSECWYTENPDFVSSCLDPSGYMPSVINTEVNGLEYPGMKNGSTNEYGIIDAGDKVNGSPLGTINNNNGVQITMNNQQTSMNRYLDAISVEVLKKMYISVQRDSAIGFAIAQRLKARGFDTFVSDAKKYFLGTKSQPVQISDVDSTADTANAVLGAYAGKGVAVSYNDTVNFTNSELGYIISISTIYPITKVVNALNPTHLGLTKYTFYNAQYDGLSYEQVPRQCVGHLTGTEYPSGFNGARLFGFHPRYTGYKTCASNVLNGGFSLRSEFINWLPYTLDRVIIENYHPSRNIGGTASSPTFQSSDIPIGNSYFPSAGEDWRIVANEPWKGNYNRIFANGQIMNEWTFGSWNDKTPAFDNFFVNTEIQHSAYCSMLPVQDSWDAEDETTPHASMSINQ